MSSVASPFKINYIIRGRKSNHRH